MKNNLFKMLAVFVFLVCITSCKEKEELNLDLNNYSATNPVNNSVLDQWIKTNFFDKYNIQVNYRYDASRLTNPVKDAGAVNLDRVKPQLETILEGMLLPYERAAGARFIKTVSPKEINLFGGSEITSGTSLLGVMVSGRQMNIYFANSANLEDPDLASRKLRTIHHEFAHAINQHVVRPRDFDLISAKHYASGVVTEAKARELGFVTPYASTEPGEDFADMVARLLVNGQQWFDDWANGSTAEGKAALKAKEASLISYFKNGLGFEFKDLQNEVQKVVRGTYKFNEATLPKWLANRYFKTITINLNENNVYRTYAMPDEFLAAYNSLKNGIATTSSLYGLRMEDGLQFRFTSANRLTVRLSYVATTGSWANRTFTADFDFSYQLDAVTGRITFTKISQPTTGTNYEAANFIHYPAFNNSIQAYLTGRTFTASWLPVNIDSDNHNKYGGFYLSDTPTNYFYGLLGKDL